MGQIWPCPYDLFSQMGYYLNITTEIMLGNVNNLISCTNFINFIFDENFSKNNIGAFLERCKKSFEITF